MKSSFNFTVIQTSLYIGTSSWHDILAGTQDLEITHFTLRQVTNEIGYKLSCERVTKRQQQVRARVLINWTEMHCYHSYSRVGIK
jgi:hypothetical protein